MTIKIDSRGLIQLKGKSVHLNNLNALQAQCVLNTLGFDSDCLFEVLFDFEENGLNNAELGLCGGYLYGSYIGKVN